MQQQGGNQCHDFLFLSLVCLTLDEVSAGSGGLEVVDSRCGEGQRNEECLRVGEKRLGVEGQRLLWDLVCRCRVNKLSLRGKPSGGGSHQEPSHHMDKLCRGNCLNPLVRG